MRESGELSEDLSRTARVLAGPQQLSVNHVIARNRCRASPASVLQRQSLVGDAEPLAEWPQTSMTQASALAAVPNGWGASPSVRAAVHSSAIDPE